MPLTAFRGERDRRVVRKRHPLYALHGGLKIQAACSLWLIFFCADLHAIPPNTPVTNTATVAFQVSGADYSTFDSDTFTSDPLAGNSPPYDVLLVPPVVDENADGVLIGLLTAVDPDPLDVHTFTVSDSRFEVIGDELRLVAGQSLDFETEPTVTLNITATDPSLAFVTSALVVGVVNVNEAPTDIVLASLSLVANVLGSVVGDVLVVDPDVGDVHAFMVDDGRFEVVAGQLKLIDSDGLPLGTSVTVLVTATDPGGLAYAESFTITADPPGAGAANSTVTFLQYALLATGAAPGAQNLNVGLAQCDSGTGFQDLTILNSLDGTLISLPGNLPLLDGSAYKAGEPVLIRVNDPDANVDILLADQVDVLVTGQSGDSEVVRLLETGPNSAEFVGYIQSVSASPMLGDCVINVSINERLTVTYTDATDVTDTSTATILVDPFGRVFDSATGTLIDGAVITLVDAASGNPAIVFGDVPPDSFSATVSSGGTVVDGGGNSYSFPAGGYRYPFVSPGSYLLQVIPPNRFAFPSTTSDVVVQTLPGAPFALGPGSRGAPFVLAVGPALQVDIPLDVVPLAPTPSQLQTYALNPGNPLAVTEYVQATQCFDGQNFVAAPDPLNRGGVSTGVPQDLELVTVARFNRGDAIFLKLVDPDQDLNPFAPDTLELLIGVVGQPDAERIRLTETAASTGIFTGYLQTGTGAPEENDCVLSVDPSSTVLVEYIDPDDATDTSSASLLLDPGFTTFESALGALLDNVTVTLIDVATGLPAQVFSADGTTSFPATIQSGGSATDGSGANVDFPQGSFYFPVIPPGTYRLEVVPPVNLVFPSAVSDADLNILATGPYTLIAGSRGANFDVVTGLASGFDLPLDVVQQSVFVTKQVSKPTAAIGDFVQYQVLVQTADSSGLVTSMDVIDQLPKGFRYIAGSARIDGAPASDPDISTDGRILTFAVLPNVVSDSVEVRYVTEITVGAEVGRARNRATAGGPAVSDANVAYADVTVREDLFLKKSFIAGQVYSGECESQNKDGLANVRILLEDGTYVVTDAQGKYHFEGVEPGSHVVQLDVATLPGGYRAVACEVNSRFAGSAYSQFVDTQAGTLWRADFHVALEPGRQTLITTRLTAEAENWHVRYRYEIAAEAPAAKVDAREKHVGGTPADKSPVGATLEFDALSATIMLSDEVRYIRGSAVLNGRAIDDPTGIEMGAVTFRLPVSDDPFGHKLEFEVDAKQARALIVTKAMATVTNNSGKHRTGVVTNELSMYWPPSLEEAASRSGTAEVAMPGVQAFEPSRNRLRVSSNVDRLALAEPTRVVDARPYTLPEIDDGEMPSFDRAWLARQNDEIELVWPPERYNPRIPSISVAIKHPKGARPQLLVDERLVNPITFEGTVTDHERDLSVTFWGNVPISEKDSVIEAQVLDSDDQLLSKMRRSVHFGQAPVRAELIRDESYLIADGIYPPVLAVKLYDRSGHAARPGISGEFAVDAPYQPLDKTKHLESTSAGLSSMNYQVLKDGIAYIQLEPTTETGEVLLRFAFDQHRVEVVRARLKPGVRDWILVGLLEGMVGHNDVSDNLEASGLEDDVITDGRVAFYAKGMIKGEWLLTAAYDTDKDTQARLRQQIDPNRFYTLYGDGTTQRYDAESQRKLYLKLERADLDLLFGDFDTGFDRAEVTRYTRTLNGFKGGYYGERFKVDAFVSDTSQALEFDEIRGDGTSGVYRLSKRNIVQNSERVSLVTRDRFQLDQIVERVRLTRYLDYTIDADAGTLIFKQPVFSQDVAFNPIFIEVEYEVEREGVGDDLVAGARIGYRLDDVDSEVAVTYINDSAAGSKGELMGADLKWQITPENKLTVEVARTDTDESGSAHAYVLELEHRSEKLAGRIFVREQELAFGLGQQTSLEADTRRYGLEGEYYLGDEMLIRGQVMRQESLEQGGERTVVSTEVQQRMGSSTMRAGVQAIDEETASGEKRQTHQLTLGTSRDFMNGALTLRADAEIDPGEGDSTDYPTRVILGAEYDVSSLVSLIVEQELSWGDERNTQDTRFGIRARPWTGGRIESSIERQMTENGERLFATTGLIQQWRLNDQWLFDFGADRVQTIKQSREASDGPELLFNAGAPPASGSIDNDFSAFYTGFGYRRDTWDASARLEFHQGDEADKWNYMMGASRQLSEGKVMSGSLSVLLEDRTSGASRDQTELRWGAAWRPSGNRWMFLNRLDLVFDSLEDLVFDTRTRKLVNNFNANYKPNDRDQLSLQFGFKYVVENIDGSEYSGITGLYGAEYRHDLTEKWDVGVRGALHHSMESNLYRYSTGISVGYNVIQNMWVSVGYNFVGFEDDDFVAADYTAKGPFLKLRLKLDQEILKRFLDFAGRNQD